MTGDCTRAAIVVSGDGHGQITVPDSTDSVEIDKGTMELIITCQTLAVPALRRAWHVIAPGSGPGCGVPNEEAGRVGLHPARESRALELKC